MAAITSTTSGNWVDGSTWVGGTPPGDLDTAVIATGHTVTCTTDVTVGSNAGAVGIGITINATNSVTFGKLIVNSGVTLVMKGNDTSANAAMRILKYGVFQPNPGSIIHVDCTSEYQTIIRNEGRINAIGTSGSHVTFSIPAANKDYNTDAIGIAISASAWKYDEINSIACLGLSSAGHSHTWISNAAGSGLGSFGDSSLSWASQSPATILATEVATLAAVTSQGKYFVDYDMGLVYFYHPSILTASATATYKRATNTKSWGIDSITDQDGNEALFEYVDFSFMGDGRTNQDNRVLDFQYKYSAAAATASGKIDRLAYVKNCTFTNCNRHVGIKNCTGTAEDKILITSNTFKAMGLASGGSGDGQISVFRAASAHIKIDGNTISCSHKGGIYASSAVAATTLDSWTVTNNTFNIRADGIASTQGNYWPDLTVSNNTFNGCGQGTDGRGIANLQGTSGHPVVIASNLLYRIKRAVHWHSYTIIENNRVYECYHHGMPSSTIPDVHLVNVRIRNNLFYGEVPVASGGYDISPFVEVGYWDGVHIDDVQIVNNTFCGNPSGAVGIGDCQDGAVWSGITKLVIANNLAVMNLSTTTKAWQRAANAATVVYRVHCILFDYNLDYNYATRYTNINRQGMFTKGGVNYNDDTLVTRAITGVALFSPNYAPAANRSLVFTYTAANDQTLAWDGGTAVQLMFDDKVVSSAAHVAVNGSNQSTDITTTGASWSDVKNDATCPVGRWCKITSGVGVDQIRMIIRRPSAQVIRVVPALTTLPAALDTFVILNSEVTLADSGGSNTVLAGIDFRSMPTSSQTDTNISFADHSVTAQNPLLVDTVSSNDGIGTPGPATDYYLNSASSPAIGVGTSVYGATLDYAGTTRDGTPDIGFFEWVAAAATGAGPGTYLRWTAGRLNVRVPPHYRR